MGSEKQLHFVTSGFLPDLLSGLEAEGIGLSDIIPFSFLRNYQFMDPDTLIPSKLFDTILERIQFKTGCESLVGGMPDYFRSTNMGRVSAYVFNQPTFLGLLNSTIAYQKTLRSDYCIRLAIQGTKSRFSVRVDQAPSPARRIIEEIDIARILDGFRTVLGQDFTPLEIGITSPTLKLLEGILPTGNYPIRTGTSESYIVFDTAHLAVKIPQVIPFDSALHKDNTATNISGQIQFILDSFNAGFIPKLEEVALMIGVSRRTVERKLRSECTSFRRLKAEYLQRKSCELLADESLNIRMISELLDFSNPQNYIRSFRSWNGLSPMEYRASL